MILFTSISPVDATFRAGADEAGFMAVLTKPTKSGHLLNALVSAIAPEAVTDGAQAKADDLGLPKDLADLTVLLVDDNMINQKVGKKILKRLGFTPDVVSSGEDAIVACLSRPYDIVLMDIEMPDMDGITATGHIREKVPADDMPYIVALTANAMSSERENYLKSGMDDYLSKPIDVDALTDSLRAAAKFRTSLGGHQVPNVVGRPHRQRPLRFGYKLI